MINHQKKDLENSENDYKIRSTIDSDDSSKEFKRKKILIELINELETNITILILI